MALGTKNIPSLNEPASLAEFMGQWIGRCLMQCASADAPTYCKACLRSPQSQITLSQPAGPTCFKIRQSVSLFTGERVE
jgi:hypothetical protein